MPNISNEISAFQNAVYGKDVRQAIVNLANKLNDDLDDALTHELSTVDATLTQSGAGADAKVVGDKFGEVRTGLSELVTEASRIDGRVTSLWSQESADYTELDGRLDTVEAALPGKLNISDVDASLSAASEHPVQNKAIKTALDAKSADITALGGRLDIVESSLPTLATKAEVATKLNISDIDSEIGLTPNPVKNSAIKTALDAKAPLESPAFTGAISMMRKSNTSTGQYSIAAGASTEASGEISTAFGRQSCASGYAATAFGSETVASGQEAFATGYQSTASGRCAVAMGWGCNASGAYSQAGGLSSSATAQASFAFGDNVSASGVDQLVCGRHNIPDANNEYSFIVGNGTSSSQSNAFAVKSDGDIVVGHAIILQDTRNGVLWSLRVTNGAISLVRVSE